MGALKNIGIDLETEAFKNSFIQSIHDLIAAGISPSIDFIDLSFGFDVDLPTGEKAEVMAAKFKESALKEDSEFKNNFIPAVKTIFDLIDTIPAINVLQAIGVTDPTSSLLPVLNTIAELLANLGITNPNQILLTKVDEFIKKADDFAKLISDIANGGQEAIESAIDKLSELINEILPDISLTTLKNNINNNVEKIKELFNVSIPEIEIPTITDFIEFFGLKMPNLPELPELPSVDDIIAMFFNFELDIPPIGVMFVEILKVKLKILAEVALAAIPPGIALPPDFLKAAIEEAKKMLTGQFSIQSFLRAIARSFFAKFFIELEATKVKNLIEKAPALVSALHATILVLVGSLITAVVGILFGEGLIMKSSAIGLGIIK